MPGADPRRPIAQNDAHAHPTRPGRPDEVSVASLALDPFADLTLALLRLHFQTFAQPDSQGWLMALRRASASAGADRAGALCFDLVAMVQALRGARTSSFHFNPDGCAGCRAWATPEERRLMDLIGALRLGRIGHARAVVQMLCDGMPDTDLLVMADLYVRRHAPPITG